MRYITRDERPGMSWPFTVVEDRDDLVALFIPRGTVFQRWSGSGPERRLVDGEWRRDMLRLMYPGAHHSTWLWWDEDQDERRFSGYYVNMEEPFRRSEAGFDTNDHMLDIVVTPDLDWRWKDEDVMVERVRSGTYSAEFAAAVRSEGERVVQEIEARQEPFTGTWAGWTPGLSETPRLLRDWQEVPVTLWERRRWAYLDAPRQ